jgi:acyl-coenzyme A thioesterase 9
MVCRDAHTHRAREVNSLILSTPDEQALFNMGEGLALSRISIGPS